MGRPNYVPRTSQLRPNNVPITFHEEGGGGKTRLHAHDAENALVAALCVLRDALLLEVRARGLGLVHEVIDYGDLDAVRSEPAALVTFENLCVVSMAQLLLIEKMRLPGRGEGGGSAAVAPFVSDRDSTRARGGRERR